MTDNHQALRDFADILKRRKVYFVVPAVLIFCAAFVLAFSLPPVYQSTATILIERPQISSNVVASSVTGYAVERIHAIRQQVMVYDNLWQMAEDLDLYPNERSPDKAREIVGRIRDGVTMEMVSENVVNPSSGRVAEVTIAFDVSFESKSPAAAQKVAGRIAELFLEENRRSRTSQAKEASSFLAAESERLNEQVVTLETDIADFKRRNPNLLPQLAGVNRELLDRAEQQRNEITAMILELESREARLESQLKEMSGGYQERYSALQAELAAAQERFSDIHPSVMKLKRALVALEAERRSGNLKPTVSHLSSESRNSYLALQSELETVASALKGSRLRLGELDKDIAEYKGRLQRAPLVETEYLALNRDYENAVQKYREIKGKLMEAQLSEELEKEQKGERLSLLQSPLLPREPIKPNRLGVVLLGLMLAMMGGVIVAGIAEFRDRTIHGVRELASVIQTKPIGVIPIIER